MDKEAAIKAVIGMGYDVVDPRTGEAVAIEGDAAARGLNNASQVS